MSLVELRQKIQEEINDWSPPDDKWDEGLINGLNRALRMLDVELASIQKRKKELEKEYNFPSKGAWDNRVRIDELSRITGEKK